jgi:hypothetical protein
VPTLHTFTKWCPASVANAENTSFTAESPAWMSPPWRMQGPTVPGRVQYHSADIAATHEHHRLRRVIMRPLDPDCDLCRTFQHQKPVKAVSAPIGALAQNNPDLNFFFLMAGLRLSASSSL